MAKFKKGDIVVLECGCIGHVEEAHGSYADLDFFKNKCANNMLGRNLSLKFHHVADTQEVNEFKRFMISNGYVYDSKSREIIPFNSEF